jgi:choline kinase
VTIDINNVKNTRAIILAAGEGTRLRPYTLKSPKAMVELGGRPLLGHQIKVMKELGIHDITVVIGYLEEKIKAFWPKTICNPKYDSTNMVYSLMCAKELLNGETDVLVTYGDIVYDSFVLETILNCNAPLCTTLDRCWQSLWGIRMENPLDDAETVKLDGNDYIIELGKKPKSLVEIEAQYMGIIKIAASFAPKMVNIYKRMNPVGPYDGKDLPNIYMTSFLQYFIDNGYPLKGVIVSGGWLETDTKKELDKYNRMYNDGTLSEFYRGPWIA